MTKRKAPEDKLKVGRPSTYNPEYCEAMIEFCKQGYSITAFAGEIGLSRDCLTKWGQEHPEFLSALKSAKAGAARWWEEKLRTGHGAPAAAIFALKNFAPDDMRDKQEHELTGNLATVAPVINVFIPSDDELEPSQETGGSSTH